MSQRKATEKPCQQEGCDKTAAVRGFCHSHYQRLWRSENPERQLENERAWRAKNADRQREYHRQRYLANREKILERTRERSVDPEYRRKKSEAAKAWAKKHPDRVRANQRRNWAKKKYGLTLEEVDAILARGCAICGTHKSRVVGKRGKLGGTVGERLCLDHDHTSGTVRDALCHSCNTGLGHFGDNPQRLRAAARYLEAHGKEGDATP